MSTAASILSSPEAQVVRELIRQRWEFTLAQKIQQQQQARGQLAPLLPQIRQLQLKWKHQPPLPPLPLPYLPHEDQLIQKFRQLQADADHPSEYQMQVTMASDHTANAEIADVHFLSASLFQIHEEKCIKGCEVEGMMYQDIYSWTTFEACMSDIMTTRLLKITVKHCPQGLPEEIIHHDVLT